MSDTDIAADKVRVRLARMEDIPEMISLNRRCFPLMVAEEGPWQAKHIRAHIEIFEEGQMLAVLGNRIVGAASALIVSLGRDPLRNHTYNGITDDGYFYNHDPRNDTLYGAEVYVDPEFRGRGVAKLLYEERRALCRRMNLKRILAGGRLANYAEYADRLTPEDYVRQVQEGKIADPVLGFQLSQGFEVRKVMPNYSSDPRSKDYASLIEWINPDYRPEESSK